MATEEVNVIALVENLELPVPRRLPIRLLPVQDHRSTPSLQQPRIIELSDRDSKVALKRQFNLDIDLESTLADEKNVQLPKTEEGECENLELLRRLPPGTVLIKQVEAKDSQNLPVKKISTNHETIDKVLKRSRNRIRKTLEVRRNPLRTVAVRKDTLKELRTPSSRQRLLATRRRCLSISEPSSDHTINKRFRSGSNGYMSTRSVTRKLGNVGATYEAPTWRDQAEWKEWPVHGMHERPVYHPQFGLAAEYNGRLFVSFDGESYREISNEPQIEIVRVDPRVESLDRREEKTPKSFKGLDAARYVRPQSTSAAVIRQKLAAQTTGIGVDRTKVAGIAGYSSKTIERLHTSLGLVQRLGPRIRLQPSENTAKYVPTNRLLSKDVIRTLQTTTLGQAHLTGLPSSSKCLIVPRNAVTPPTAPVSLPFCEVQAVKSNSQGKLFFVKAHNVPKKKIITEKTCTITSSTQSSSVSWAEVSLRKRPDGTSTLLVDVPRTFANSIAVEKNIKQPRQIQPTSRGYPPIKLSESTSIFRPKVMIPREDPGLITAKCNGSDFGFRSQVIVDDHQDEVLDLSKKDDLKLEGNIDVDVARRNDERNASSSCVTDLVHYFKNFGADENIDLFEDPKNLT